MWPFERVCVDVFNVENEPPHGEDSILPPLLELLAPQGYHHLVRIGVDEVFRREPPCSTDGGGGGGAAVHARISTSPSPSPEPSTAEANASAARRTPQAISQQLSRLALRIKRSSKSESNSGAEDAAGRHLAAAAFEVEAGALGTDLDALY